MHYAIPHATTAWIAREMLRSEGSDVKVVTTLHGTDITLVGQDPSYWSITKFSIEHSDGLTAVSEYLQRRDVRGRSSARSARSDVIPNFIDPAVYQRERYECQRGALAPEDEKIVMHISNFRRVKRIQDVVRVFDRLARSVPSRLIFVGDGPERQAAEDLSRELGREERVTFLGKLESVAELLACADLFLLPSEEESFGLVALEAMASGVPVVGSSGSGLSEVVTDGLTGRLHPVGDVEAMAESAVELLSDSERWSRVSRAARESAIERYSSDRIVPQYESYYEEVLAIDGA